MSEAKHTPGPWDTNPMGRVIARCGYVQHSTVWASCEEPTQDEVRANARLIAAAPELLDALSELVLYHDVPAEAQDPIVRPLLRQAFAAIAKATTQQAQEQQG